MATVIGTGGLGETDFVGEPVIERTPEEWTITQLFYEHYSRYDPFYHEGTLNTQTTNTDIVGNRRSELMYQCAPTILASLDIQTMPDILFEAVRDKLSSTEPENDVYYYHGDHLGSANWVTNASGEPIQYIHYAPYGEEIENQRSTDYDERYKFTGKERDAETDYDFFGARYFWSAFGNWLSVDPLADKYPGISPYAYCNWNPVMLVDVTGKEPNKKLMGTSAEFRLLLDNSPRRVGEFKGKQAAEYMQNLANYKIKNLKFEPTQTGYFNNKKGRYVYTKKGGWIDMVHFLFYAGKAYKYKCSGQENPVETAISDGMMQEKMDQYIAPHSAYSYEDLPTDAFGAYFGANYYDPNSDASFGEQVEQFLNEVLQATEPYCAPNFDALPKDDKSSSTPSKTNTTTTPIYTIE